MAEIPGTAPMGCLPFPKRTAEMLTPLSLVTQIWGWRGKLQGSPYLWGDPPHPQGTLHNVRPGKSLSQYDPNGYCVPGTGERKR